MHEYCKRCLKTSCRGFISKWIPWLRKYKTFECPGIPPQKPPSIYTEGGEIKKCECGKCEPRLVNWSEISQYFEAEKGAAGGHG